MFLWTAADPVNTNLSFLSLLDLNRVGVATRRVE